MSSYIKAVVNSWKIWLFL